MKRSGLRLQVVVVSLVLLASGVPALHAQVVPDSWLLSFGDGFVPIGTTVYDSVELTNTGTADVSLVAFDVSGSPPGFELGTAPGLPLTMGPGTKVTVEVAFTPITTASPWGRFTSTSKAPMTFMCLSTRSVR